LHFTALSFDAALNALCNPASEVSSHYLIKATGEVFQLVDDHYKAWHAGKSFWQGETALNDSSIGIEIDNLGNNDFTPQQLSSCIELCESLKKRYNIDPSCIIGHSDIAPDRKIDPGIFFNWQKLADHSLGIWPSEEHFGFSEILLNFGEQGKEVESLQQNLRQLGYKIDMTGKFDSQTNFVVRAFQSHFNPAIIQEKGIEFYLDYSSKYSWDSVSDKILRDLLSP
jgi:N-acetylmuramoyl-L-alanine amidase